MISIKDYASSHGISYEAVRRQIARYSGREIDGFRISDHIIKVNRTQYLDDEAVGFLDTRRAQNPIIIQQEQRDETIERLRMEVDALQKRLIAAQDEYRILLQDKHAIELREQRLLADKGAVDSFKTAVEEANARAKESEEGRKRAEEEAKAATEELQKIMGEVVQLREEAATATTAAAAAKERADKMDGAGLLARIFRSW